MQQQAKRMTKIGDFFSLNSGLHFITDIIILQYFRNKSQREDSKCVFCNFAIICSKFCARYYFTVIQVMPFLLVYLSCIVIASQLPEEIEQFSITDQDVQNYFHLQNIGTMFCIYMQTLGIMWIINEDFSIKGTCSMTWICMCIEWVWEREQSTGSFIFLILQQNMLYPSPHTFTSW